MPEGLVPMHLVLVPTTATQAREVAALFEVRDDALNRSLRDPDLFCHVAEPHLRIGGQAKQNMGVVREKRPSALGGFGMASRRCRHETRGALYTKSFSRQGWHKTTPGHVAALPHVHHVSREPGHVDAAEPLRLSLPVVPHRRPELDLHFHVPRGRATDDVVTVVMPVVDPSGMGTESSQRLSTRSVLRATHEARTRLSRGTRYGVADAEHAVRERALVVCLGADLGCATPDIRATEQ
jgi:hypothetical protein